MTTTSGLSPVAVPERATRAGETCEAMAPHQEWSWVEPQVWTARMLAALIEGVKGGKWYNRIAHIRLPIAFFARHGFSACSAPMLRSASPLAGKPSTGEPDAGDPHVRFGGRGDRTQSVLPTPIRGQHSTAALDTRFRGYDDPSITAAR
jgi:hypothetical protein